MDPAVPSERKWDWGLGINLLSFGGLAVPSQTVFGSIGILYIYIHTSYIYMCVCVTANGETHIQWWLIHGNHDDEAYRFFLGSGWWRNRAPVGNYWSL